MAVGPGSREAVGVVAGGRGAPAAGRRRGAGRRASGRGASLFRARGRPPRLASVVRAWPGQVRLLRAFTASALFGSNAGGSMFDRTWSADGATSVAGGVAFNRSSPYANDPVISSPATAPPQANFPIPRPSIALSPLELSEPLLVVPPSERSCGEFAWEGLRAQLPIPDFWEVVTPPQPHKLAKLIQDLRLEMRRSRLRCELYEMARIRIDSAQEIVDWAKGDRRWSFTLAEMMNGDVHQPHDLATGLVVAIADELEEESELLADNPETNWNDATNSN